MDIKSPYPGIANLLKAHWTVGLHSQAEPLVPNPSCWLCCWGGWVESDCPWQWKESKQYLKSISELLKLCPHSSRDSWKVLSSKYWQRGYLELKINGMLRWREPQYQYFCQICCIKFILGFCPTVSAQSNWIQSQNKLREGNCNRLCVNFRIDF